MDFGDFSDNPFSVELKTAKRSGHASIASAAKFLLIVAGCFTLILIIGSGSKRWLVHQLTYDLDSLAGDNKKSRLIQIAELGPPAVEPLVRTLADDDIEVARTAYDLLRQAQNQWTVLDRTEIQSRHAMLIDALESIAVQLPDDRTGWGTSLLQQTIMMTVDRRDDPSRALYREATHAMELLSLSDRAGPSILSHQPLEPLTPRRLTVRPDPLPVLAVEPIDSWTDWPPPTQIATAGRVPSFTGSQQDEPAQSLADSPSVYRSSARLQPVQSDEPVILLDINEPQETAYLAADVQSVTHLVDSPMETFDDKSVIHWLASPHRSLREKARSELIARGYEPAELAVATQIASGDTNTRIELIDAIARSPSMDPRPWLLMMLADESRDVKLRVVSVLATMNDPGVSQRLRMHLVDEHDPTVAARIRRVLNLR